MSTTAVPPSSSPSGPHASTNALLSLLRDPRQVPAWLGVTPNWLRAALVAVVLLAAFFALAIRHAAQEQFQTIKTIQVDSAPSIFAGQRMRASLADMHGNLTNELLKPGAADDLDDAAPSINDAQGKPLSVDDILNNLLVETSGTQAVVLEDSAPTIFRKRRSAAVRFLVAAARNITYPGEVPAVWTILNELARYEEHAGRSRVLHDHAQSLAEHQAADEIMRLKLLPAIDALIAVNQGELDKAYDMDRTVATEAWLFVLLTGAALLAAIVGLKVLLFNHMRRVLNPPLLVAAALTAAGCPWALGALWQSSADIKSAKQDAFDSIKVLEAARAVAYDANGDESGWLLVKTDKGKPDQLRFYADAFKEKAAKIAAYPGSHAQLRTELDRTEKAPAALKGYLADELNNITFDGELHAARETLLTFLDYLAIDQQIRDLKDDRQAVELCLGTQPGQSDWAFDQFEKALGKTIKINRMQFDASLGNATGWLAGLDWLLPLGLALAVSVLTFLGLRPRLNEYVIS